MVITMRKSAIFYAACQLFGWILMILSDLCEETGNGNFLMFLSYFILPLLVVILYAFFLKNAGLLDFNWKQKVLDKLVWIIAGLLFAVPICYCVNYRHWFIEQNTGFFDGLEYFVFAFLYNIGCLLWFIIFDIFYYFYKKKKNR